MTATADELSFDAQKNAAALERKLARLQRFVPIAAAGIVFICALDLLGWATNISMFKSFVPSMSSMKVNTALELTGLGVAMFGIYRETRAWRWIARFCIAGVFLLGGLTAAEYIFNVDLHIDNFLFVDPASVTFPGRSAPAAITSFYLAGIGLLLLDIRRWIILGQMLMVIMLLAPLITLGGYLYGAPGMYLRVTYPVLSLNTSIAQLLLCIGALLLRPGEGLMRVVTADTAAGSLSRRLLPAAIGLPLVIGLAILAGERENLYGQAFGSALLIGFCAIFFAASVWWTASLLDQSDEERTRAQKAAQEYAERFSQVANVMPLIVWTASRDGTIDYYNRHWYEFTGVPVGDLTDAWRPLLHPEDTEHTYDLWGKAIKSGEPFQNEFRLFDRMTGRHRWFLGRATLVRSMKGSARWYGVCTDIDDQKRAEETATEAMREAESANSAKDQFLAVLSHELRTPLTPVLLTVSMLENRGQLSDSLREELKLIRQHVELEARLIDDLLDLTRINRAKLHLNLETVDVHQSVRDAIDICCFDRAGDVQLSLDAPLHFINGDPARLKQIFWNLFANAAKFTQAGKKIRISTSNVDQNRIQIKISDEGIGISADALPRIFKAFEQADSSLTRIYGGLGLGLTISKALVDSHGGSISASSDGKTKGATFVVEFNTIDEAKVRSDSEARQNAVVPSLRILLVEDHLGTRTQMTRLLTELGHKVKTAASVQDAVELGQTEKFDMLISDLGLPDGNGRDVMQKMRGIKGIAVSGFGMEADMQKSMDAGFIRHLIKPLDVQRLRAAIHQVWTDTPA